MNLDILPGLSINSEFVSKDSPNFKPETWPPSNDFPVTLDSNGNVLSSYGDIRWDLSVWVGHKLSIYFGDGKGKGNKIDPQNASILRQITAWWVWGPNGATSGKSLVRKFALIKPIFWVCTEHGVLSTDINDKPHIIDELITVYKTRKSTLIPCLNSLILAKEYLGFVIIDEKNLHRISHNIHSQVSVQTAYIPPRIWSYQVSRLEECLNDFINYQQQILNLYNFCLFLYANNSNGNLDNAFPLNTHITPFNSYRYRTRILANKDYIVTKKGYIHFRSFSSLIQKFGIDSVLKKWIGKKITIRYFTSYLSLVSIVGMAYTLNYSLMRVQECSRLRANCLDIDKDEFGNDIHFIKGETSKTLHDLNAKWIVPPTVKKAIDVMEYISKMRQSASKANPYVKLSKEDLLRPPLQPFTHEPWSDQLSSSRTNLKFKKMFSYSEVLTMWPKLFDLERLKINSQDLEIANRLTSNLDSNRYQLGSIWPMAWHQLRRTGAVNMLASGLVTESSLQYQLKHANRAMSLYYGKNYYKLTNSFNSQARNLYIKEMFESIARSFKDLNKNNYISPHGNKRKKQILSAISEKDHKQLIRAAKQGNISYRETLLGGCVKTGAPCPYGGITNLSHCMGQSNTHPCESVVLDKTKLSRIKELKTIIVHNLENTENDSLLSNSLTIQLQSTERAIHVIENK